jgi:hypothetical protein
VAAVGDLAETRESRDSLVLDHRAIVHGGLAG